MRFIRPTRISALTVAVITLLTVALAACGKEPDERACELHVKDFGSIFALERDEKALFDLRDLATEIEEIAQEGSEDVAAAAERVKVSMNDASRVVTEDTFEASVALDVACNNHGYTYEYFYPDRRP